VTISRH